MADDREIMHRIQQGETSLFDQLAEKYRPRLLRFASSKLADTQSAEDVVQETLLAAFSARASYRPEFAFSTWIWTILLNLCRTTLRKRIPRVMESLESTSASVTDGNTAADGLGMLLAREQTERLLAMLDRLPEAQGDAIRLRFFVELTFEEIAETMSSSVSGAKKRVRCGLEQLAAIWNEEEVES